MANQDLLNLADIRAGDFKLVLLASLKIILRVKGTFLQKMTSIENPYIHPFTPPDYLSQPLT